MFERSSSGRKIVRRTGRGTKCSEKKDILSKNDKYNGHIGTLASVYNLALNLLLEVSVLNFARKLRVIAT